MLPNCSKHFGETRSSLDEYLGSEDDREAVAHAAAAAHRSAKHRRFWQRGNDDFAVVYKDKKKYSIEHDWPVCRDFSVVIPSLLASVPPHVAASSGMDALCQGIESYWSIHSTEESRELAAQAIRLAWASIEEAVNQRTRRR